MNDCNKLVSELRHYFEDVPLVMEAAKTIEELNSIREMDMAQIVYLRRQVDFLMEGTNESKT